MKKFLLIAGLIFLVEFVATVLLFPHLPTRVATHWDLAGHPNGWSSRLSAALLMPACMVGVALLGIALPWLSPRNFELKVDAPAYLAIMLSVIALLGLLHIGILAKGTGMNFDIGRLVLTGVCLLFAVISAALPRLHRNFYVGVRTPWTLANDRVWSATHHFAAQTFLAAGVVGAALALLAEPMWPAITVLAIGVTAPVVYSLVYYKQLERRGEV
jgi:uncharacterized membrane protein